MRSRLWTQANLAWLAGLMEGEGSFYLRRAKGRPTAPSVALQMTDVDVVTRAAEIAGVGGGVYVDERSKRTPRVIQGRPMKGREKDIYMWRVQARDDALALMWALYPWMGDRRRGQIQDCVLEWMRTPYVRRTRMAFARDA